MTDYPFCIYGTHVVSFGTQWQLVRTSFDRNGNPYLDLQSEVRLCCCIDHYPFPKKEEN